MRRNVVVLVCLAVGCADPELEWQGSISSADGIPRVTNPGEPLGGADEAGLAESWRYSGPAEGDLWGVPRSLAVDEGRVYVVDDQVDQIHVVGIDGTPIASLGRSGEGPGEYSRPVAAVPVADGVLIVDGGNSRIDLLGADLSIVESHRSETVMFAAMPWRADSLVVLSLVEGGLNWVAWDREGAARPVPIDALEKEEADGEGCFVPGTGTSSVFSLTCTRPEVRVFSFDGVQAGTATIDIPDVEASDQEIEVRVRALRESFAASSVPPAFADQQVEAIRDGPRAKHMFRKVVEDPSSGVLALWSQNPEDYGSGPARLYLMSPEGIHLATLDLESEWLDFAFRDSVLYSLETDVRSGLVTLVARRLTLDPGLIQRAADLLG